MNAKEGSVAAPCRKGCGFFSGVDSNGLCSVCFKDFVNKGKDGKEENEEMEITPRSYKENNTGASSPPIQAIISNQVPGKLEQSELSKTSLEEHAEVKSKDEVMEQELKSEPPRKKKSRCFSCKKKLGLTGFSCRCGGLFCAIHRYSDKHECKFDYKALGQKEIAENNSLVVAEKISKI